MTMAKNDNVFLPIWLKYYSRFFKKNDTYVLDHESNDGSTDNIDHLCNKEIVHYPFLSDGWKRDTVMIRQQELLRKYEYVIFTDPDEFIAPDPEKFRDLEDFMMKADKDIYRCKGYFVFHSKDEPNIDSGRPLLRQRKSWVYSSFSSKPLISRIPLHWTAGFHLVSGLDIPITEDLVLLHLGRIDHDIRFAKHLVAAAYKWADLDLKNNWSWHYRITEPSAFDDWFYSGAISSGKLVPENIPEKWKDIL